MYSIAGFCNFSENYFKIEGKWQHHLATMQQALLQTTPSSSQQVLDEHFGFCYAHTPSGEAANLMQLKVQDRIYAIIFSGELYNIPELKQTLLQDGCTIETDSEAEILLQGLVRYGMPFINQVNGVFALAYWDSTQLFLVRDRAGVKPLFYTIQGECIVFSSALRGLLAYPGIKAVIDTQGLSEIFALGPARTPGSGVFKGLSEIKPGYYAVFNADGFKTHQYWDVSSAEHLESEAQTIEKTAYLINDAIQKQTAASTPISSLLSGGVDSSIVTAIAAKKVQKEGNILSTFSFEFDGNDRFFKSSSFQPELDRPWVEKMVAYCGSKHHYLKCATKDMTDALFEVVDAKDLPGMADVDSSLLYFCKEVSNYNKIALTGECADEIFGGYPWFHSQSAFETHDFPWSSDRSARKCLLSGDLLNTISIDNYARQRYQETIALVPKLDGENEKECRRREIAYLNLKWFMTTLIDRMERASAASGITARVPFADYRIIEYLWNVPWDIKCTDGVVKSLLRASAKGVLPDDVLYRKKSPYPKSYNPAYEKMVGNMLLERLNEANAPIRDLLDLDKVTAFVSSSKDYGKPWFGQLMAGPQLLAYMLQIDYWLRKYDITIAL